VRVVVEVRIHFEHRPKRDTAALMAAFTFPPVTPITWKSRFTFL
jgi:hypothetical protein